VLKLPQLGIHFQKALLQNICGIGWVACVPQTNTIHLAGKLLVQGTLMLHRTAQTPPDKFMFAQVIAR
jgi:hypothetical protein